VFILSLLCGKTGAALPSTPTQKKHHMLLLLLLLLLLH
jgi:hypothetical protein